MIEVGAFQAKTHFSELLADVAKGETILITRHGQKIAMLVPIKEEMATSNLAVQAVETIRTLRKGTTLGKDLSIKQMKAEGRK